MKLEKLLKLTFFNRRKWINENIPTIEEIENKYPRLFDFHGYMVKYVLKILTNNSIEMIKILLRTFFPKLYAKCAERLTSNMR